MPDGRRPIALGPSNPPSTSPNKSAMKLGAYGPRHTRPQESHCIVFRSRPISFRNSVAITLSLNKQKKKDLFGPPSDRSILRLYEHLGTFSMLRTRSVLPNYVLNSFYHFEHRTTLQSPDQPCHKKYPKKYNIIQTQRIHAHLTTNTTNTAQLKARNIRKFRR